MSNIARGTTPTIKITINDLDFSLVNTNSFRIYFKQMGYSPIIKSGDDVKIDATNHLVETYLTQNDTINFVDNRDVRIEVRWLFNDELSNGEAKAGKTSIMSVPINSVLKKEVIDDG